MPIQQIITPEWLKRVYLYGVDLTNDRGDPYPDDLWFHAIDSAVAIVEAQFDLSLSTHRRRVTKERYDTVDFASDSWHLMMVRHRPLIRVIRLAIRYGSRVPSDLPKEWIHVASKLAGQIQIIPGPEGFAGFNFALGGIGFELSNYRYIPGWFEIDYETGFEIRLKGSATVAANTAVVTLANGVDDDGEVTVPAAASELKIGHYVVVDDRVDETYRVRRILSDTSFTLDRDVPAAVTGSHVTALQYDPAMVDLVGLVASLLPLDTAGDLIIGAGISSQSLSMDGLSQSISTTSGVENSGYGARAIQYGKRMETVIKYLTRHYRPINMMVV